MKEGKMGGTCSTYGENGNAFKFLAGNPQGKRHLGVDGKDNIKMYLEGVRCGLDSSLSL
jgi:hypothetical protein